MMQLNVHSPFANTITPYNSGVRTSGATVPADQYTPSFPPVDHPSSLEYARHRTAHQPLVYVPDFPGKPASKEAGKSGEEPGEPGKTPVGEESSASETEDSAVAGKADKPGSASRLSENELEEIEQLIKRDREVRAHEQAHATVGGQYAGSPSYSFKRGPDGISYAVAGEVPIDVSPVEGDPEATIQKMQQVQRAALAPAEPSGQDRAVAATAARLLIEAQAELAKLRSAGEDSQDRRMFTGVGSDTGKAESHQLNDEAAPAVQTQRSLSDTQVAQGLQTYRELSLQGEVIREQGLWARPLLDVVA